MCKNKMKIKYIALFVAAMLSLQACDGKQQKNITASKGEEYITLSFPKTTLKKGERLAALEITITNGSVRAINYIPEDWTMGVKLVYSWKPRVTGGAGHGAGWVSDISDFDDFLLIRQWQDPKYKYEFDIEAKLFIDKEDEEEFQTKILKKTDLILKKKAT